MIAQAEINKARAATAIVDKVVVVAPFGLASPREALSSFWSAPGRTSAFGFSATCSD